MNNEDIQKIIDCYDLGNFKDKKLVYNGWNTSYKLITSRGVYLLKSLNFQNKTEINREISIVKRLKNKIPVVFPITSKEGKEYIEYKKKIILIYPFINGKPVSRGEKLSPKNLIALGKIYATINKTSKIQGIPRFDLYEKVSKFFGKLDKESREYRVAAKAIELLKKHNFNRKENYPSGLIHADLHTENILMNNEKIVAILDFEEAHVGSFIYDIGLAIFDTCWIGKGLSEKRIMLFLKGYESVRKLTETERPHLIDAAIFSGLYNLYFSVKQKGENNPKNFEGYSRKRFLELLKRS